MRYLAGMWIVVLALTARASADDPRLGRLVERFGLQDSAGATFDLPADDSRRATVLVFVGVECPLVQAYVPRLNELAGRYAPLGVTFLAVDSNRQDSLAEIAAFARRQALSFPLLKDVGNALADAVGAQRTPEVVVLDAAGVVRYCGRIDDRYGVGYARTERGRDDLGTALDELLAGQEISVPATAAPGCLIGRVVEAQESAGPTWSEHVAPILQKRCQNCHRAGQIAPFALTDYDAAAGWAATIAEVIEQGRMPPWYADAPPGTFVGDGRLTADERETVLKWVAAGAPQGDPALSPPPPVFTDGWLLHKKPDLVVPMDDEPFEVPASGVLEYEYFVADPRLEEDVWVDAAEARPGNPQVVHHINVFVLTPEMDEGQLTRNKLAEMWELQGQMLCGYVPGMRPSVFPPGMAKRVPAGSKFVFQMHYTPRGSASADQSQLGLVFAPRGEARRPVITVPAMNNWFEIPPGEANYRTELTYRIKQPSLLLAFLPHMHLRGRAFRYTAEYPDGRREVVLDVPKYDFMWQNRYVLAEPKRVPAGTRMHLEAWFDNSAGNLANPDPRATVRWGEQSFDEMMIGYFDLAPLADVAPPPRPIGRATVAGAFVVALAVAGWAWRRPARRS